MELLLDTHVWIWYLLADPRLSPRHRQIIEDRETELWLSPITLWEAAMIIERKRIDVGEASSAWLDRAMKALPVREAGLTFAIARRSRTIALDHADPADRFICATALELNLTLLTADEAIRRCPEVTCVL